MAEVPDRMSDDTVLGVGRDCLCGFPLVRRGPMVRCSVYGTHPAIIAAPAAAKALPPLGPGVIWPWDRTAPAAGLIQLSLDSPAPTRRSEAHRERLRLVS